MDLKKYILLLCWIVVIGIRLIYIVDNTTIIQYGKGTMRKHKYKGYFVPLHNIILNVKYEKLHNFPAKYPPAL